MLQARNKNTILQSISHFTLVTAYRLPLYGSRPYRRLCLPITDESTRRNASFAQFEIPPWFALELDRDLMCGSAM